MKDDITTLYTKERKNIQRHLAYKLGSKELAKEYTQEAFCRLYSKVAEGQRIDNPRGYLSHIVRNMITDFYRTKDRKPASLDKLREINYFDIADRSYEQIVDKIDGEIVSTYLEQLRPKARKIMKLKYYDGLGIQEIMEKTRTKEVTVHSIIRRGHAKLNIIISQKNLR